MRNNANPMSHFNPHTQCAVIMLHPDITFSGYVKSLSIRSDECSDMEISMIGCEHALTSSPTALARTAISNLLKVADRINDNESSSILRGILVALDL